MNNQWNKKCNDEKNHKMIKCYSGEKNISSRGTKYGKSYKEFVICSKCGMKVE